MRIGARCDRGREDKSFGLRVPDRLWLIERLNRKFSLSSWNADVKSLPLSNFSLFFLLFK